MAMRDYYFMPSVLKPKFALAALTTTVNYRTMAYVDGRTNFCPECPPSRGTNPFSIHTRANTVQHAHLS